MLAIAFWLSYLLLAFGVAPAVFRARYGRWPYAYSLLRPDRYMVVDFAYGALTIAFTMCLLAACPASAEFSAGPAPGAGFLVGILAILLMGWAMISLGASWRVGQDIGETDVQRVTTGPYRLFHHPIYISLVVLSIAMALMAGATICILPFTLATVAYTLVQSREENRHWHGRA